MFKCFCAHVAGFWLKYVVWFSEIVCRLCFPCVAELTRVYIMTGAMTPANGSVKQWLQVALLSLAHVFADGYCMLVAPLLAYLTVYLDISEEKSGALFSAAAFGASMSQIGWGYLCDRYGGRWVLIFSPLVASVVGALAWTGNYWVVMAMVLGGALGTGAFHPVAGALSGRLVPKHNHLCVSLFIGAGMMGVGIWPVLVTQIVDRVGVPWLWTLMLPAPVLSMLIWYGFRNTDLTRQTSGKRFSLREALSGHTRTVTLLFATAFFRVFPICAYHVAVPFMVKERFDDVKVTGYIIGLFCVGLAVGGVIGSSLARRFSERTLLIASLLAGIPAAMVFSFAPKGYLMPAAFVAGSVLGSTVPLAVSMGQKLVPRGDQMFSALMMGLSWGLPAMAAPFIVIPLMRIWGFGWATFIMAAGLMPATVAAAMLPARRLEST